MTASSADGKGAGGLSAPIARLAIVAAFVALWQVAPAAGLIDPRLLPPPSDVVAMLVRLLGEADFRVHIATTLSETAVAFLIAVPAGFLLSVLIGESPYLSAVFKPLVFFIFSIPKSIFLPLFIFGFGITFQQKVAFGVFSTIFIVMMLSFAALESVRSDLIRVAMIFNFTGVLLAEMYASRRGLGNVIEQWGQGFQLDRLLATIVLVAAIAIVFNEAIRALETRSEHWRV